MTIKRKSPRTTKSAAKKTTAKRTAKKRAVKKQARKTVASNKPKRRKRTKKNAFSFAQLKTKLNSKITKIVIGISFVSAAFPSAYEWGSSHISRAANAAQPVIAEQAEGVIKQAVSASPLAKTAVGIWLVDQVGKWTAPSNDYDSGGQQGEGSTNYSTFDKVDTVVNPFY